MSTTHTSDPPPEYVNWQGACDLCLGTEAKPWGEDHRYAECMACHHVCNLTVQDQARVFAAQAADWHRVAGLLARAITDKWDADDERTTSALAAHTEAATKLRH